ncbi:hypothetical protein [Pulveribacter sp.]|nr:hypothetical protein [Pulveribacter sp.]
MTDPKKASHPVPASSGRNRFATHRTLILAAIVVAFLLLAIWVPW